MLLAFTSAFLLFLLGTEATPSPEVTFVQDAWVSRRSDTKNERGLSVPPFKDALITTWFSTEPPIGEKVTIIPENGVPSFDLRIESAEKWEDPEFGIWWQVNLEVKSGPLLTAPPQPDRRPDHPLKVIVVYPAVEGARWVAPATLDPASIPSETSLDLVHMAADLDGDRSPDVVIVEFCCKCSTKDAKNGCTDCDDYVCGKTFLKTADGWKKVSEKSGH